MNTIMEENRKQMISAKNASDLYNGTITAIQKVKEFAEFNDYQFKNDKDLELFDSSHLLVKISNLSLKKRKVLRNYIWLVSNACNLATANKFLHFLSTKVIGGADRYRIVKSEKQLKIEETRKKYNEALAAAKKAHAEYKAEKGDFYKSRLAKGQQI